MADSVNMSLDEIIKKNQQDRVSRSRGRGGVNRGRGGVNRGRGGGRGRGRGRGGNSRGRSRSRPGTPSMRQTRSQSRGPRGRAQSQPRSQSRTRSRSRQQRRSSSRVRSRSRSQRRSFTPKGRAGLEEQRTEMPQLFRAGRGFRGGYQNRLRRGNSNINGNVSIHSRLGVTTRRGAANANRPLAVVKRGILKRGRGLMTGNRYSNIGLRSDQILKEQQNMLRNSVIKSQTFTRSRNNSFGSASQLTVSVANDFAKKRRNSVGNAGYLNKQSLAQLNNQFGGYNTRRGPGSVKSMGSNKSNRSNRSIQSNSSRKSTRSRGRGRGGNRGIGRKFVNKQVLNLKLQKEIAAIQGKSFGSSAGNEPPSGINFSPTPAATGQTLHQRFAST